MAVVPGTVHTDLVAAGRIPEPLIGDHEEELKWIEDETWTYRLDFDVDVLMLAEERVDLVFEGLDTWAQVTLNGRNILYADNMFRTWRVPVKGALRIGTNTLEIQFLPPVREGAARAERNPWPIPHQEPDASGTRAFSRKAQYHYGWDWGPRYVTSGIWRPVRLESWSGVRIEDARVAGVRLHGDTATVRFAVDVRTAGAVGGGSGMRIRIKDRDRTFKPKRLNTEAPPAGASASFEISIDLPEAELWWPRGAGVGSPHLYEWEVSASVGKILDRRSVNVGVRTVELVTEPDSIGQSFYFRVNGRPLFTRGANVVPPDHFTPRADSATYRRLIGDAAAAHMNMLRVWGGGIYLPDLFYDLADETGILVWQDFMFANTLVPGDSAFAASVSSEAADQVRRLRHHPSLALWCGNNEIVEGWRSWGWEDAYRPDVAEHVEGAYRRVFEAVLPRVLERFDPNRPYLPSSPRHGWGDRRSLTEGDSHYWGVWHGMEPFRAYAENVPRFASEFGFQALPEPMTIASFGASEEPTSLTDPLMRAHQKHPDGYQTLRAYLAREWPVPADDSLDAWSYVTQLAQAEGVGLALEAHRRSWPHTGGTLYWQLNDTWPVVSWSSLDYAGRWKALHYRARDVFAPVAVLGDAWNGTVAVWVATDGNETGGDGSDSASPGASSTEETLTLRVRDFEGATLAERGVPVSLPSDGGSVLAWRGPASELLPAGTDRASVVIEAVLQTDEESSVRDLVFLQSPARLSLPDPGLRIVDAREDEDGWHVSVTADRLAYAVRLAVEGVGARFSDNYAHILPGDTLDVLVTPEAPTRDLPDRLRLRSLGRR